MHDFFFNLGEAPTGLPWLLPHGHYVRTNYDGDDGQLGGVVVVVAAVNGR